MESIDSLIQDRHLQMIKAALPYLDNSRQSTVALFNSPGNNLRMCSEEEREEIGPFQMLNAIRDYCTDTEKEMVDNIMTFFQMFSTYETLFA